MNKKEYLVEKSTHQYKRICLTLDLKNKPELIKKYKYHHRPENNWPEINKGIKESGIQIMEIYAIDNRMFMICEVEANVDFDACWAKMATFPKQAEWGKLMAKFQQALPGHPTEWVKMERLYSLPLA